MFFIELSDEFRVDEIYEYSPLESVEDDLVLSKLVLGCVLAVSILGEILFAEMKVEGAEDTEGKD